jgi:heptosyltransferase II
MQFGRRQALLMNVLIIKLGATGDVVRTTPLLRRFKGPVSWITAAKNKSLLEGVLDNLRVYTWEERDALHGTIYDLVVSLEDDRETGVFVDTLEYKRLFGAYWDQQTDQMVYTADSSPWFDLSLISSHGRTTADKLKLQNRRTYQEYIFEGLGLDFRGDDYLLPLTPSFGLRGDVAISSVAGPVWPMKAWAYYKELQRELESRGFSVNVLPTRPTLSEHLADVRGHRCLVSGDSLPMHLALGSGVRCVSLFTCTSPWEIYDYNRQIKLVSPLLGQFFYQRSFDARATTAIGLEAVLAATLTQLRA